MQFPCTRFPSHLLIEHGIREELESNFTSVPVIHRELQRMHLLDSTEHKEPLWLLVHLYRNFNSF